MENRLKEIRIKEGLTITELSKKSDVSTRTISRIENSEGKSKVETLNKLLKNLNELTNKSYSFENVFGKLVN
ncbi:MAG: hypothetical protein A2W90_13705 [Bacteroidetes bacterium GWF2_42_66]|nr:MAG: hypothetical protein A2W92_14420 [Bacteroidetes bacterium GWA2_42_15]OFX97313.1 MAG: hypothetical protein A2W89_00880 [Bacteroidetes bacterium GWE2_42_39]OFY39950.1 MAG: hypothetical protein A2W90_13705 [Bacteroidetes bacterium GWF2_42_66]HBL78137.1 transcriptional regulator [Prolixibacteraceae bacterium]HCR91104.1 transcriptional regulator [Prolixibacteraceae bacterium]